MREKIAVFRALYLGDMLLAVPALRALRRQFSAAEITLIGLPWAANFVARYPYVDRFVEFGGYPGLPEVAFDEARSRAFLAGQRAYGYDFTLQMHGSGQTSNAFVRELRANTSVGYFPADNPAAGEGLTIRAAYPQEGHEIERNLGLVNLLDGRHSDLKLEFPLRKADFQEIEPWLAALAPDRPWVALHVGAKHPARRWSPAAFASVADTLIEHFGAHIILTGSAQERSTVQNVVTQMRGRALNLAGQTSLGGLAALISALDLFISNDTGPAHLAYALDTPSLTLFGPTDYWRWRPLALERHRTLRVGVECSPCAYQVCPIDHRCLTRIAPERVYAHAADLLNKYEQRNGMVDARAWDGSRDASLLSME